MAKRLALQAAIVAAAAILLAGCGPSCKSKSDCPSDQTCVPNSGNGVNMCCPAIYQCGTACCPPALPKPDGGGGTTGTTAGGGLGA